ncbi:MAG: serine O-acetyltransferase [Thermoleophilaceae bacterium]|jgi:serine O-acetyltransferase|nr:serine O-acetyltransferase [Thermoleophilaceae bacterium]
MPAAEERTSRRWLLFHFPLLFGYQLTDRRAIIDADVRRWGEVLRRRLPLSSLLTQPAFRTLYYHRLRSGNFAGRIAGALLSRAYPGQRTLYLDTPDIGPGLYIQHGFATILAAERVGANCWINQQVTVGYDETLRSPILEDGVSVHAGAKVIGGITLHAGCRVGANAVVVRDVPAGTTAVGVPAHHSS